MAAKGKRRVQRARLWLGGPPPVFWGCWGEPWVSSGSESTQEERLLLRFLNDGRCGRGYERVECLRYRVEIVPEEPGVHVKCHRRGGVAQHELDSLDVGPGGDCQGSGGMPQIVRRQAS